MIERHFRTTFDVKKLKRPVTYRHRLAMIGSCFTENIGSRLKERGFRLCLNPSGIIYNPVSIATTLEAILQRQLPEASDLHCHEGKWFSYEFHGHFAHPDKERCLEQIREARRHAASFFQELDYLLISPGTAWIYRLKESGKVVANCHKVPQQQFVKELLSAEEVTAAFGELLRSLRIQLPELKVIFTLSPVRHVRDGVEEDRLSKSILRYALHQCVEKDPQAYYFPAYELLTDDLRDYRFYGKDLVHPNELAQEYIWSHFREACIGQSEYGLMEEMEKLNAAVHHRPLHPDTEAHRKFIRSQEEKIERLAAAYDFLDLSAHRERLRANPAE